ncbi:MAG: EAL domain-containing protein [Acidobacteriia bacterium]|nr:EAL domain-containing protein [Terriglobia bacterium]
MSAQMMEPWYGWLMGGLAVLAAGQQLAIYLIQQRADKREELFQIVTENAADMIALVDVKGRRLYNSPAYKRVLGYSPEELGETSAFEQIHPDDRFKVLEAAREARTTGVGGKLEYRIRHKDGTWRVLESAASTIKNPQGEVEKLVIVNRDVTERKQAQEQLEHNSFHDTLTGLPNRRLFLDRLQRLFVRAQRNPAMEYAVLFVDVDNFKIFNDMMGYAAGDQVLVEIGRRLMDCLRHDDTISRPKGKTSFVDAVLSRLGGDEFTILLDGIEDPSDALRAARRIQTSLVEPFPVAERELRISTSVGIALNTPAHRKAEDVLQDADVAMRRAKALGGSRCEVFDEAMHTRAVNRLRLETELREAIEKKQFRVYYLPMVELASKRITGFEALLRWQHPEQGLISPTKFLEAAEDTGLLVSIGQWLLLEACRQVSAWTNRLHTAKDLRAAVNLSAKQFAHPSLVDDVRTAMQEAGLEPGRLSLEMNEGVAMADPRRTAHVLSQLRSIGVSVILDDFGAAYSSLRQLRDFPIEAVKIDRTLTSEMLADRGSGDIVETIILLVHKLNLQVIAEGIESATQLDRLRNLGCELGQGYLFSQPLAAEAAEQMLRQQRERPNASGAGAR